MLPLSDLANCLWTNKILNLPLGGEEEKKSKIIIIGAGLEGFVDWVDPNASDSTKDRVDDMSSLVVGFVAWMHEWASSAQGETTLGSEVSGGKHPKRSGPDEET